MLMHLNNYGKYSNSFILTVRISNYKSRDVLLAFRD